MPKGLPLSSGDMPSGNKTSVADGEIDFQFDIFLEIKVSRSFFLKNFCFQKFWLF